MILPPLDMPFRCPPVFDKQETTARFKHSTQLPKRTANLWYAAQRHVVITVSMLWFFDWNGPVLRFFYTPPLFRWRLWASSIPWSRRTLWLSPV
jgi:hypothetical protein